MLECPLAMKRKLILFLHIYFFVFISSHHQSRPSDDAVVLFDKIIALHPKFRALLDLLVKNEDAMNSIIANVRICTLILFICTTHGYQLEFYGNGARSEDINKVRYAIVEILPLDPVRDVITPPIIGSKKSNRGWNHNATAAALCPLRLRAEFDEDPLCVYLSFSANLFIFL